MKNHFKRRLAASIRTTLGVSALVAASVLCGVPTADAIDVGTLTSHTVMQARHVPEAVRTGVALRVGTLDESQHLSLAINLPHRNQADLDQLLKQLYDPQSANFRQYLSTEEFTSRFGPTQSDYDAVVAWAKANSLNIVATSSNRRILNVEGSVGAINQALGIQLKTYQHPTEERTFFASDAEPTATGLNVPVLQIVGLDNYTLPHTHLHKATTPVAHAGGSGPSGEFLPSDMRAAYYGSGSLTGSGQCIGIFSFDGYLTNDISVYKSNTGMSFSTPVNNVLVGGFNGACTNPSTGKAPCDDGEQILDIVNAIGMAPGITQIRFYEGTDDTTILNSMATDSTKCMSLSSSWGWSPADASSDDPIFQQFAAQGQSFMNATGDSGQFNSSTYDFPSVDQYITQVGGTDLTTASAGGAWSSETGWADSGGGFMTGTAIPSWQQISGVINTSNKGSTTLRNAPDVAMEANFDNPTVSNGTFQTGYGGTSFAAPRWAGFIALANQQAVANGLGTVGFVNPTLYNIGVSSNFGSDFHDITSGNNKPSAGSGTGFNAVTGYDLVTGWGSPKAALITTLAGGGGGGGTADFSLTDSPTSVSVTQGANSTDTITVVPVNGFSSSVSLSASGLPSGVTASFSPASTTTSSTLTLTASSTATTGNSTVTITGTSGSLTHTTTLALTVNPTGGGGGNVLSNGVAVTGLSGTTGTLSAAYTFTVPAGATNVSIAISGGTGDADLYVKAGSAPTLTSYDCRPYVTGNSETCSGLSAGVTYYVKINAYATYSGVSLVGNYTTGGGGGGNTLTNGVPLTGLSGTKGTLSADYTLTVPSGKTSVTIKISGGTGDADMYVKLNAAPTLTSYDCRPYVVGNNETCTFTPPSGGGVYHVKLNAYATYSGVSLTGSYSP